MNAPALLPTDRPRHDGWLPDRQRGLLAAIADGNTVAAAAQSVGMSATATPTEAGETLVATAGAPAKSGVRKNPGRRTRRAPAR